MICKDRNENVIGQNEAQDRVLKLLYETVPGRMLLCVLVSPWVSKAGGKVLSMKPSACFIPGFIKKNNICMEDYEEQIYHNYNEFFTRRIAEGKRKFDCDPHQLCAPCDSKLSVYPIQENSSFCIKNTEYTMKDLFRSKKIAEHYKGGTLLVFRLTVDDYHHYSYIDDGVKSKNYRIKGVLHTVNPLANDIYPIYKENAREFSVLKSHHFGPVLMMEVGALMVGKIVNLHEETFVHRGEEKGYFEFGGSTVILCFEKDRIQIDEDILNHSKEQIETVVKMGEKIGVQKI